MSQDDLVEVAISDSPVAAEAALARLRAAGLDAQIGRSDPSGDPAADRRDLVIMVPASQQAAAHELLLLSVAASTVPEEDSSPAAVPEAPTTPEAPTSDMSAATLDEGLARIRRRRLVMWFWFFSYLPVALLVTLGGPPSSVPVVAILWMIAFLVAVALVIASRCPRCQKRFCSDGSRWNPYTTQCLNCGLPLRGPLR
jgi:hypothetical protein